MYFCQFRAGEIVIGVYTPEQLALKEPYSSFLCENQQSDVIVRFDYIKEIGNICGNVISNADSFTVSEDSENLYFYYHATGESDYYALRKVAKNNQNGHEIFIPEKYAGMIWTRLVFSLLNFDDVAAHFGCTVFHASFIEHNGESILFTAPCETGKSTQAALWEKYTDAEIINGDKVLLYEKDGRIVASGLPFSGSSDICKNRILPVRAIVYLGQSKVNKINRLKGIKAYKAVFEGCYYSGWNPEYNKTVTLLAEKIAVSTPVYHLECLPDKSAVDLLFETIYA